MRETPITITYSLEEVLKDINGKLYSLQKDVNTINETLIKVETKQDAMFQRNIAFAKKLLCY